MFTARWGRGRGRGRGGDRGGAAGLKRSGVSGRGSRFPDGSYEIRGRWQHQNGDEDRQRYQYREHIFIGKSGSGDAYFISLRGHHGSWE